MVKSFCILGLSLQFIISSPTVFAQDETADIQKTSSGIVLDGIMENAWDLFIAHPLTYMIDGVAYPDSVDCSGYFKACWKNDSLFLLMFSVDDVEGTSSPNVWENDGYEVYFDLDNSKDDEYQDDNYQFRFNVGSTAVTGREGLNSYNPPDIDFALETYSDNSRILEAVFPLVELGKSQPIAETHVGFDCQILDNDGSGREAALAWNNNEHEAYFNPGKMGTIFLSENVVISVPDNTFSFRMFPNPVKSKLTIESDNSIKEVRLLFLDGRIASISTNATGSYKEMDVSFLLPGIYIIELLTSENIREVRRIIKVN